MAHRRPTKDPQKARKRIAKDSAESFWERFGRGADQGTRFASASKPPLVERSLRTHAQAMFVVTEEEATAIRAAFDQGGEFAAAVELRRHFPGITDNAHARACARTIAGWKPLELPPRPPVRPRKLSHR